MEPKPLRPATCDLRPMRVVAGAYKGRRLQAPKGTETRPTSDRVREALFSILGDVSGARVLDLYAGSGALGIEALSRGAGEVVFVETGRRAADAIRANLRAVGDPDAMIWVGDALAYLRRADPEAPFDLVFADPPYSSATQVGEGLSELLPPVLTDNSLTVTESDKRAPLPLTLPLVDERVYGDTRIAIHRGR
jgi:16S rRNA (guanine966-N2)-methyltransferase